jgi:hypothetical protein
MPNPNIKDPASLYLRADAFTLNTATAVSSTTTLLENPASTSTVFKLSTLVMSNSTGAAATATVYFVTNITNTASKSVLTNGSVPGGASLVVVGRDNPLYLPPGTAIRARASTASSIDAVLSFEEIA